MAENTLPELLEAAGTGNLERVQKYLELNPDSLNSERDKNGCTAIYR
jgi:hypothetical protein